MQTYTVAYRLIDEIGRTRIYGEKVVDAGSLEEARRIAHKAVCDEFPDLNCEIGEVRTVG
jgi:uncharacterized protein (UPF0212 family)